MRSNQLEFSRCAAVAGLAIVLLVFGGAGSVAVPRAATPVPQGGQVFSATIDRDGTVWGVTEDDKRGGSFLCRWTSRGWVEVASPGAGGVEVESLIRGRDGAVFSVSNTYDSDNRIFRPALLVRSLGATSWVWSHFPKLQVAQEFSANVNLYPGTQGDIWCQVGIEVIRFDHRGAVRFNQCLDKSIYVEPKGEKNDDNETKKLLDQFVDGRGRLWFYTHFDVGWGKYIPGFVIAGANLAHFPKIKGLPSDTIDAATPVDRNTVWAFVYGKGLYAIDVRTMTASRATHQLPNSVYYVFSMTPCNGSVYVVAGGFHGAGRRFDVWRYRNRVWRDRVKGVDEDTDGWDLLDRQFVATRAGVWISSTGNGYWLDPTGNADAIQVDWHRGFCSYAGDLLAMPDGGLLYNTHAGTTIIPDALPPLKKPASGGWIVVRSEYNPAITTKGVIFFEESTGINTFDEWDGSRMNHVVYPHAIAAVDQTQCLADDHDRYWPLPDEADHAAGYYDLHASKWRVFNSLEDAYLTTYRESGAWSFTSATFMQPAFSVSGHLVFRDGGLIYYYNGKTWLRWNVQDIGSGYSDDNFAPVFTAEGEPSITLNAVYALRDGLWIKTADLPPSPYSFSQFNFPPGCPVKSDNEIAFDKSTSTYWYVYNNRLYRQIGSQRALALPADGVSVFDDGSNVRSMFKDAAGNTWLSLYGTRYVMIPRPKARGITIDARRTAVDSVSLRFWASSCEPLKYIWRINDGPWSGEDGPGPHKLDYLPNGTYRIDVCSIDNHLAIDFPTTTRFTITVDTAAQLQRLIGQLSSGSDAGRNQAVTALARQPNAAVPALNAALANAASDEARWWITAAIQACQQASGGSSLP